MRIRLDVSYDGTDFHGWARQPGLRTVQGELERALATVLRVEEVAVTCAGRTDTGVHARGQVVHLDVADQTLVAAAGRGGQERLAAGGAVIDLAGGLTRRLNGVLGGAGDLVVRRAGAVGEDFDARFSALWRRYTYRIREAPADPLERGHVLTWDRPLDLGAMNRASAALLGEQDFASFCKRREGATTVRTLQQLSWAASGDGLIAATVRADAFCHHMVRSLVGCLLAVGDGRRDEQWPVQTLAAAERSSAVAVVPAHGLTLEEVGYPADDEYAAQAVRARTRRDT